MKLHSDFGIVYDIMGQWEIDNLHPVCENRECRGKLILQASGYRAAGSQYLCEKCQQQYPANEFAETIARKIVEKVRRNNFPR